MTLKRYLASLDTTITNAFKPDLSTRATGSNMGASDVTEVFEIYGQSATSSLEKSRALYQFPIDTIASDRTATTIPDSGSVKFFLRLFNAKHSSTVPKNATYAISAISQTWVEGNGLSMDLYKDTGYGNWIAASSGSAPATATISMVTNTAADLADGTVTITGGTDAQTEKVYIFKNDGVTATGGLDGTSVVVQIQSLSDPTNDGFAEELLLAIESANGHNGQIKVSRGTSYLALEQTTWGQQGNNTITTDLNTSTELTPVGFVNGDGGNWSTEGGDYYTDTSSSFDVTLADGDEDIETDITTLVEQWVSASNGSPSSAATLGSKTNYGVIVRLSGAFEDGTDQRSYYTKKFFARGTEFFFKRPVIEARWDAFYKDDRGKFYYSSSLAPAVDNLNTLFLYNYINGQLTNIPSVGTGRLAVQLFSGSNGAARGDALTLSISTSTPSTNLTYATGGFYKTGIYTASMALTAASTPFNTVFDIWLTQSVAHANRIEFSTGSIYPTVLQASPTNTMPQYVVNITNLKDKYAVTENPRLRLFTRKRNQDINVFTVSNTEVQNNIVDDVYYKVVRMYDGYKAVDYGTGSLVNDYTRLSYDVSGNYFDFDMSLLETDYMYGFKFALYIAGDYKEQDDVFKFRVE